MLPHTPCIKVVSCFIALICNVNNNSITDQPESISQPTIYLTTVPVDTNLVKNSIKTGRIPSNIKQFTVNRNGQQVLLQWELNNTDCYELQIIALEDTLMKGKSIGSVTCAETLKSGHYSYEDKLNYRFYQLRLINQDGTSETSSIVTAENPEIITGSTNSGIYSETGTDVYPNPSNNPQNLTLRVKNPNKLDVNVKIYDMKGTSYLNKDMGPFQGTIQISKILETELLPGIYIVEINLEGEKSIKRLIIY